MKLNKLSFWLLGLLTLSWPDQSLALSNNLKSKLDNFGNAAGYASQPANAYSTAGLAGTLGGIVKIILAFLGVLFLIIIIVSGFKWMTTSNPEEIKKIRIKLINAVIGLLIILASYAITYFVLTSLVPQGLVGENLQVSE